MVAMETSKEKRLLQAIEKGYISGALLLTGPMGGDYNNLGRKAAALYCGVNIHALENYPDYIEIGKEGIIIDHIRSLQKAIAAKPFYKNRALLLMDVHNSTEQAQNALLKTLEEPPPNTLFILAGREDKLLYTIRSRCIILRLEPQTKKSIFDMLTQEGIDDNTAGIASILCGGAPLLARDMCCASYVAFFRQSQHLFFEALKASIPPYQQMGILLDTPAFERDNNKEQTKTEKKRERAEACLTIWQGIAGAQLRKQLGLRADTPDIAKGYQALPRFTIRQIQDIIMLISFAKKRVEVSNPQLSMDGLITSICKGRNT